MRISADIKKIKIQGHRQSRTLTCPYCGQVQRVTLVTHMKRRHPRKWEAWSDEFVRLYNETNDLKRVMRAFTNAEGYLVLSWTVVDNELKRKVAVDGRAPQFNKKPHIPRWSPTPEEYKPFRTTVWNIPIRGTWGVHQSTYRGNWAPQVPRALIEMYSKAGDVVLDPFVGGGTTLIEALTLGRHVIGYDVSETALAMSRARLEELRQKAGIETLFGLPDVKVEVRKGDARKLIGIKPSSIDFICTHPPYGNALTYTHNNSNDISRIKDAKEFLAELQVAGKRFFEVLKPKACCAILIGDLRRDGVLYPFGFETARRFQRIGFRLNDIIIKTQSNDRSTEFYFKSDQLRLLLAHEYLLNFVKP